MTTGLNKKRVHCFSTFIHHISVEISMLKTQQKSILHFWREH